jgi:hypothetical protein
MPLGPHLRSLVRIVRIQHGLPFDSGTCLDLSLIGFFFSFLFFGFCLPFYHVIVSYLALLSVPSPCFMCPADNLIFSHPTFKTKLKDPGWYDMA